MKKESRHLVLPDQICRPVEAQNHIDKSWNTKKAFQVAHLSGHIRFTISTHYEHRYGDTAFAAASIRERDAAELLLCASQYGRRRRQEK